MEFNFIPNKDSQDVLIFLHGWACNPGHFDNQVAFFKSKFSILIINYTNYIVNYNSLSNDSINYFELCLLNIKSIINDLELKNMIFIGHSLGGVLALELSVYFKDRLKGLAIIDTTLFGKYNRDFIESLYSSNGRFIVKDFLSNFININYDDTFLMNKVIDKIMHIWEKKPAKFNNLLEGAIKVDKLLLIKKLNIKFVYLARKNKGASQDDFQMISKKIHYEKIKSGHFMTISAPDYVNTVIGNYIKNL